MLLVSTRPFSEPHEQPEGRTPSVKDMFCQVSELKHAPQIGRKLKSYSRSAGGGSLNPKPPDPKP